VINSQVKGRVLEDDIELILQESLPEGVITRTTG